MSGGPGEKVNQFAHPHGVGGRVVGFLMALLNADMERRVVNALALSGSEAVLEIGFGPGVGIGVLAKKLPRGFVAGIDPSDVMVAQATKRNHRAIEGGQVELRSGTASSIPWEDERFDAVVSVNNVQEWPSLRGDMSEVRRALKADGQLTIGVHAWVDNHAKDRGDPRHPWEQHIVEALADAGFSDVRSEKGRAISGRALYFTANKARAED